MIDEFASSRADTRHSRHGTQPWVNDAKSSLDDCSVYVSGLYDQKPSSHPLYDPSKLFSREAIGCVVSATASYGRARCAAGAAVCDGSVQYEGGRASSASSATPSRSHLRRVTNHDLFVLFVPEVLFFYF